METMPLGMVYNVQDVFGSLVVVQCENTPGPKVLDCAKTTVFTRVCNVRPLAMGILTYMMYILTYVMHIIIIYHIYIYIRYIFYIILYYIYYIILYYIILYYIYIILYFIIFYYIIFYFIYIYIYMIYDINVIVARHQAPGHLRSQVLGLRLGRCTGHHRQDPNDCGQDLSPNLPRWCGARVTRPDSMTSFRWE